MLPNAPGAQGWNPYWYANANPATLTDPTGFEAAAGGGPWCGLCTLVQQSVIDATLADQAALAAAAPVALASFQGQRKWVAAGMLLVAFLLCTVRVACREGLSTVVGGVIPGIEAVKLGLDLGGQSIGDVLRGIRDWLGVWLLAVPVAITVVKTIDLPKPDVCRLTLELGQWFLTPERYDHIKMEHGPSSTAPGKAKYTETSWTMLLWLIDSALYRADYTEFQAYRGRCRHAVLDFGFPTGTDKDQAPSSPETWS